MFKVKRLTNYNYILKTYNYLLLRLLEIVIFTFSVGTVVLGFSKPPTVTTNKA